MYTFFGFSVLTFPPSVRSRGSRKDVSLCVVVGKPGSILILVTLSESDSDDVDDVDGTDVTEVPGSDVPGSNFTRMFA